VFPETSPAKVLDVALLVACMTDSASRVAIEPARNSSASRPTVATTGACTST